YAIEIYNRDGSQRLGAASAAVDWTPVLEWARFTATRHDAGRPVTLADARGRIEPVWNEKSGEPYVGGLKAIVLEGGQPPAELPIPLDFFKNLAQMAAASLVKQGQLAPGEKFQYAVCAVEAPEEPPAEDPQPGLSFSVEPVAKVLDVAERSLDELLDASTAYQAVDEQEMPVFIPRGVLEEVVGLTQKAGCVETGGILIGHLRRDSSRPEVFLEVTAQIPARYVEQNATRLTFTKETWAAVDDAIALRRENEMYLGWWHSHPAKEWCKECPPEKKAQCQLTGDFFSLYDVALHRTVFSRAYSIALVISDSERGGLGWGLFGWRYGQMGPRGFHISGTGSTDRVAAVSVSHGNREE
ncbi:MAG TPA: Mov34/MPN/PAD-1 family protein, partial [Polyangia bacterium]|nr:Mov34/MPN/PAD-1 family protein [Polyangia bacterium]